MYYKHDQLEYSLEPLCRRGLIVFYNKAERHKLGLGQCSNK